MIHQTQKVDRWTKVPKLRLVTFLNYYNPFVYQLPTFSIKLLGTKLYPAS